MPTTHSYQYPGAPLSLPPPTTNDLDPTTRAAHVKSDRKASQILGITITRAPDLRADRKASQILGTTVIRSDWNSFACDPSPAELAHGTLVGPSPLKNNNDNNDNNNNNINKIKKKEVRLSPSKMKWMKMGNYLSGGWSGGRGRLGLKDVRIARRAQKVILAGSLPDSPGQRGRRHTVSYGSRVELMLPSSSAREWPNSPSSPSTSCVSDTATASSGNPPSSPGGEDSVQCPSTPSSPPMPLNPVVQRRKELVRSAIKSVQILGSEVSNLIMKRLERENTGRIGWDD